MPSRQPADAMIPRGMKLGVSAVAGLLLWACGSDSGHPTAVINDTVPDATTNVHDANTGMDVARSESGTRGDGSADGGDAPSQDASDFSADEADAAAPPLCMPDAGPVHLDQPTAPAATTGVCQATIHRAATTSVSAGVTIRFVGLTPDALTIAWFESGTLNYADRANATSQWNPAHSVDGVTEGPDRPALSPDGLRIVVVKDDRHGFAEYVRSDRVEPHRFGSTPSETQYAAINAVGVMFGTNEWFGSPVLSGDDRTFVYLRGDELDLRHDAVYASTRSSNVSWPMGSIVHATELEALCGRYRRPTALSSDALTLFYWDETVGAERATFRKTLDAPFAGSVDLGDASDGVPNAACSAVYFSAPTGGVSWAGLTP